MPVKYFAALLAFWLVCLIVAFITASAGNGLYVYIPARSYGVMRIISPPNNSLILFNLFVIGGFILFRQLWAIWFSVALGVGLVLGSCIGPLGSDWTPGPGQHILTALMLSLAYCGFQLRDYLD